MSTQEKARRSKRVAVVGITATTALVGAFAMPAQASTYTSHLTNVNTDFESSRWHDNNGGSTTIKFTSCTSTGTKAIGVTLRKDQFGPDPVYTTASYTACFKSGATSSGTWSDHGSGDYYFVVNYGSNSYDYFSVKSLSVYY
ncbi:hypothetical protein [Streptomyces sp. SPB074]|uniref:hypothetical protein n=1 Tax=Streptomyces sp. (strain SPB074) TaxID=465543 RepID=UPI00017FEBD2|nr:hypothetical protein [Streptomyces sp. SPB074]EDY44906.1 hypothetical protein SSBG_02805 [Streptomyces sp. SPB074]